MNRSVTYKFGAMALLVLGLMLVLGEISGIIRERQQLRDSVVEDIARSSSREQQLTGPIIVVPYRRTVTEWVEEPATQRRTSAQRKVERALYFLPETLRVDGRLATERRMRGIYEARLYHATQHISGHFELPAGFGITEDAASYEFGTPYLTMGISDIRGIERSLTLAVDGTAVRFVPGSGVGFLGTGIRASLPPLDPAAARRVDYALDLNLQGTSAFHVTPVGRDSTVLLRSDWPHPSFTGDYLPVQRSVSSSGFEARWQTSVFSTNIEEALRRCATTSKCEEFESRRFGVSLVDPVDQYLRSERAIKYALLFVALTFAGFFLFEVLGRLAVHPIQYGLVGAALALFYMLLLSLSEHIGFALAYAASGTACVALIGFYVSHVLHSAARGLGFGAGLGALYGLLYGLLSAEDYALLMGSLLLFGLLAAVMVLTRRVDWFNLTRNATESA